MKTIHRSYSIITGCKNLVALVSFPNFPVFIGATNAPIEEDLHADMNWFICPDSGMIQLNPLLPCDIVYAEYHSEAVGGVWLEHHHDFVRFCLKYDSKNILEIGGSNGYIAKQFIKLSENSRWTIIEPTPQFEGNKRIKVIKGFFDRQFVTDEFDTVIHSHVIEHTFDPSDFLSQLEGSLSEGKLHLFSVPNLLIYLQAKFTNTINFEHTTFLTESFIDYLLQKHQFQIIEKVYFGKHSIFYATRRTSVLSPPSIPRHFDEYKAFYLDFIHYYEKEIERLNACLSETTKPVFLFGAHIFSQFLLYLGLDKTKIINIIDNSNMKQGKRLYGTTLSIQDPSTIQNQKNAVVILKAGQYQQEIKQQLLSLNIHVEIWE